MVSSGCGVNVRCENCGSEMRSAKVCPSCRYNHLLGRMAGARSADGSAGASHVSVSNQPSGARSGLPVMSEGQSRPIIRRRPPAEEMVTTGKPGSARAPNETSEKREVISEPERSINYERSNSEDNLIRFPVTTTSMTGAVPVSLAVKSGAATIDDSALPEWRLRVREKVRESRERRGVEPAPVAPEDSPSSSGSLTSSGDGREPGSGRKKREPAVEIDEAVLDPNPIVESALKRIRRSTAMAAQTSPPTGNRVLASGGQALNLALEIPDEISENRPSGNARPVRPEARPEARPEVSSSRNISSEVEEPIIEKTVAVSARAEAVATESREALPTSEPLPGTTQLQPEMSPGPRRVVSRGQRASHPAHSPATRASSPTASPRQSRPSVPTAPAVATEKTVQVAESAPAVRTTKRLKTQAPPIETTIVGVPHSAEGQNGGRATFWVRTLAAGCDFEIIAVSFLPIFGAYAVLNTILEQETLVLMLVLLTSLTFVYQAVTLTIAGRTYGMAMLNLRLISLGEDPELITKRQRLMRAWAATIAFLLPPLNLLVRQSNVRRLSLPDLVSNTIPVEC
jgi:uncharacterized RDD family membrane protein YckC